LIDWYLTPTLAVFQPYCDVANFVFFDGACILCFFCNIKLIRKWWNFNRKQVASKIFKNITFWHHKWNSKLSYSDVITKSDTISDYNAKIYTVNSFLSCLNSTVAGYIYIYISECVNFTWVILSFNCRQLKWLVWRHSFHTSTTLCLFVNQLVGKYSKQKI